MNKKYSIPCLLISILFIAVGMSVFGIRLIHAGPYAMPQDGALLGGLSTIALGIFFLWKGKLKPWGWVTLAASPVVLFPALYSIMGESEEVISLYAKGPQNTVVDLRLWIVDRDDGPWVGMARNKALTHNLHGQQLAMLRAGKKVCVVPVLHEDRATARAIHSMKVDKYKVAQLAGAIGLYPLQATDNTVVLRLDSCPES